MPETTQTIIENTNHELSKKYPEMLLAVWQRCMHFAGCTLQIAPTERKASGWLEWGITISFPERDAKMYIAAIQRNTHGAFEFHS